MDAAASLIKRADPAALAMKYELPLSDDPNKFLAAVARKRGRLKRGGVADVTKASIDVLRDFAKGEVKFFVRPPAKEASVNNAEIVSQPRRRSTRRRWTLRSYRETTTWTWTPLRWTRGSRGDGRRRGNWSRPVRRRGAGLRRDGLSVLGGVFYVFFGAHSRRWRGGWDITESRIVDAAARPADG